MKLSYINKMFIIQINPQEENGGVILNLLIKYITKKKKNQEILEEYLSSPSGQAYSLNKS